MRLHHYGLICEWVALSIHTAVLAARFPRQDSLPMQDQVLSFYRRWRMAPWVTLMVLALGLRSGRASDASYYAVIKALEYQQLPGGAPTPLATNAYLFTAFVVASTNFAVTNVTVDPPGATPARTLTLSSDGSNLRFEERFSTQSALDSAYPSVTSFISPSVYPFTIHGVNDGARTANASYLLGGNPPTPNVTNVAAAQSIDSTADFTVKWAAPSGGLLDIVQLLVIDSSSNAVYASPAPFSSNALSSSSVAFTIPAYALPPSTWMTGYVAFARSGTPNTSDYPGATGIAANARVTGFPMLTRPAPAAPLLEAVSGPTPFRLRFNTETNRVYHLLAATNLVQPAWEELIVTNAVTNVVGFSDEATLQPEKYYRVRVGQ